MLAKNLQLITIKGTANRSTGHYMIENIGRYWVNERLVGVFS